MTARVQTSRDTEKGGAMMFFLGVLGLALLVARWLMLEYRVRALIARYDELFSQEYRNKQRAALSESELKYAKSMQNQGARNG